MKGKDRKRQLSDVGSLPAAVTSNVLGVVDLVGVPSVGNGLPIVTSRNGLGDDWLDVTCVVEICSASALLCCCWFICGIVLPLLGSSFAITLTFTP